MTGACGHTRKRPFQAGRPSSGGAAGGGSAGASRLSAIACSSPSSPRKRSQSHGPRTPGIVCTAPLSPSVNCQKSQRVQVRGTTGSCAL